MNEVDESRFIDELIAQGENQTVEFKKSDIFDNTFELAKQMTAFANTNGGRILIGVCDDGTLEGMKAKKEHEIHIMNIARDRCDPPLAPKFSVINKPKGDIYVIKILRYQALPHAVKTKDGRVYFIRVGSTVREATPSELALLFESAKEEVVKKPKLKLLLIDPEGNATTEINAYPTYVKTKKVKSKSPPIPYLHGLAELSKVLSSFPFIKKEPAEDLIPIGIELTNVGEAPAYGIRVFLEFPQDCELIEEHDVTGGLPFILKDTSLSSGGLFVDPKNENEASAWVNVLGNDLTMRNFEKVYVRFPEKEQEYKIKALVTQYNFPPENFEFKIYVKPKIVEKIEYVYEQGKPEETSRT
jgi:hypothetical protein